MLQFGEELEMETGILAFFGLVTFLTQMHSVLPVPQ